MAYKIRILKNGKKAPFHFRLHDSRRYHRLRKRDLAELFGVTTGKITQWEEGKTMPHMNIRRRVELWIEAHYPDPLHSPLSEPPENPPTIYKEEDQKKDWLKENPWIPRSDYSKQPAMFRKIIPNFKENK